MFVLDQSDMKGLKFIPAQMKVFVDNIVPLSNALYSNSFIFMPVLAWFLFTEGQIMLTTMSHTQFDLRQVFPSL